MFMIKDYRNRKCSIFRRIFARPLCKWKRVKFWDAETKNGYVDFATGFVCGTCGARKTECDPVILTKIINERDVKKPGQWLEKGDTL